MKTRTGTTSSRRHWLQVALISTALALGACSSDSDDDDSDADAGGDGNAAPMSSIETMTSTTLDGATQFVFILGSDQEVPSLRVDGASGEGNFTINTDTGAAEGSVVVSGLTGDVQAAHLHRGFAGTNGPIEIALESSADGRTWSLPADTALDAIQLDALSNGELYVNVHTEANAGGEIRGQIVPDGIEVRTSTLSGDNEVPAVVTDASGAAVVTVNPTTMAINATVMTTGVDDATMAHIHIGPAGENGAVIISLEADAENVGTWRTPASSTLTADELTAFQAGGLYFNVHTPANPGGELRGQL